MTKQINRRRFKNLLFVLASAFTLNIYCISYIKTNASAPADPVSNGLAAMQVSPQEKTVEQVRKNIQVLKGLPDSQFFPVATRRFTDIRLNVAIDDAVSKMPVNQK